MGWDAQKVPRSVLCMAVSTLVLPYSWLVVCRGCEAACCHSASRNAIIAHSLGAETFPSFQTPL